MSCFLPPLCLFCNHFDHDESSSELSCKAFNEIPDEIFSGDVLHTNRFDGDQNLSFVLNPEMIEEYNEVNDLRLEMEMEPFPDPNMTLAQSA